MSRPNGIIDEETKTSRYMSRSNKTSDEELETSKLNHVTCLILMGLLTEK